MKTIYKVNGKTFSDFDLVVDYCGDNGFEIVNVDKPFIHNGKKIICVNIKSEDNGE